MSLQILRSLADVILSCRDSGPNGLCQTSWYSCMRVRSKITPFLWFSPVHSGRS